MACFHPIRGWRSRSLNDTGKRPIVFDKNSALNTEPTNEVQLPCGQCVGCRLERSRQWAMRCVHEAQMYDDNCFVTLTYSDENLPAGGSLHLPHFQKFMKRLRKKYGTGIRFFHCGEYGDQFSRPHYHACIFNHDFPDKVLYKEREGIKLYTSVALDSLWTHGHCTTGDLTFESAAYTARYVMKKISIPKEGHPDHDKYKNHYTRVNPETGEIYELAPEYTTMSRRPGIGHAWYSRYQSDIYPSDFVVLNGKQMSVPKFYDLLLEKQDPEHLKELKNERKKHARTYKEHTTLRRLQDREAIKLQKSEQLTRSYESE